MRPDVSNLRSGLSDRDKAGGSNSSEGAAACASWIKSGRLLKISSGLSGAFHRVIKRSRPSLAVILVGTKFRSPYLP
jgi:hypothetical protein